MRRAGRAVTVNIETPGGLRVQVSGSHVLVSDAAGQVYQLDPEGEAYRPGHAPGRASWYDAGQRAVLLAYQQTLFPLLWWRLRRHVAVIRELRSRRPPGAGSGGGL